jgi:hypothetical protein
MENPWRSTGTAAGSLPKGADRTRGATARGLSEEGAGGVASGRRIGGRDGAKPHDSAQLGRDARPRDLDAREKIARDGLATLRRLPLR